ncbi:low affinity iron permease family protein [Achromobacter sp. Bel]|uniref:low affinity iron permease family protein n=1 Tax=Achromobacter sp. Bel TaxID=2727415 RepID=UPI00145EC452|nr:low affinity iron permease family protein [Achromobacter sp. Bel]NMK49467.1 low affinity iron permease family protein [Achromobacter sp. Bel]
MPEKKHSRQSNAVARFFDHFAAHVTKWAGSPVAFGLALGAVLVWSACGPMFGYSETWQLVINTGTTIITFLMVFLIQQSQNKDGQALHLKLDELLIALKGADEGLVDAERLDEDKLLALAAACTARARLQARSERRKRRGDRPADDRRGTMRGSLRVRRKVLRAE